MNKIFLAGSALLALVLLFGVITNHHTHPAPAPFPSGVVASTSMSTESAPPTPVRAVGAVTRHAKLFLGSHIRVQGYLLKRGSGYVIFSDEQTGALSKYDLPVLGPGIDTILPDHLYLLDGVFESTGFVASNGSPNDLRLSIPPVLVK